MREDRRLPLVRRIFIPRGIRTSLLGAFIVLTFVPLAIMGLVLRWQAAAHMTAQVVAHLSAVSTLEVQEVEGFFAEHAEGLGNVLLTSEAQDNALYLLRHSPNAKGYRLAEGATYDLFQSVLRQDEDIAELFLIDREGIVVLSTEPQQRGALGADQIYFLEGLQGRHVFPLLVDPESGETMIYLAEPVHDFSVGINRGVLVARLNSQAIDDILSERIGLGGTGEVYLVVPPGQLITPLRHVTSMPPDSNTHGIREALAGHEGFGLYTNYAGTEVIGYYRWLPEAGAGLIAEQARDEALAAVDRLTRFALVVVSLVVAVTIGAILISTQRITRPIIQLATAAEAITAGNWETPIPSGARDEVSTLAKAFQAMTDRLRELIETLEQRVAERTAKLTRANERLRGEIIERKRAEEALSALLLVDDLTGLYNRRGFFNLVEQQLKIADRTKRKMLLLFADFDDLKQINDTLGHREGDLALIEIAHVLKETFRQSDIIARIGGDEFVVLAMETDGASAEVLTARLRENLEVRNARGDRRYKLSLSVGITRYDPENPCSIDELLARADRLMYEQKQDSQKS
jgi:diguanylate cyclase (GGDEF)-like protein